MNLIENMSKTQDASTKLRLCDDILIKIDRMIAELKDITDQIVSNNNPKVEVLDMKLEGIKEIEDECQIDDSDVVEWDGKKDKIFECGFDESYVAKREYSLHQLRKMDTSEYGYGYWIKFMMNVPKRFDGFTKSKFIHVSRVT